MGQRNGSTAWAVLAALTGALVGGCESGVQTASSTLGRQVEAVSATVARGEDLLTPAQLNDWLVAGTRDLALVDLRSREDFGAGHIRDARHIPLAEAVSEVGRERLRDRTVIVVYAHDTAPAAQAAVLLRLNGLRAYFLDGGYIGWLTHLGAPAAAPRARPADDAKRLAAACRESHAWDEARTSGFVGAAQAAAPVAVPVTAPAAMAPAGSPPFPAAPPAPPPPLPAFTPPVVPVEAPAAGPAPPPDKGGAGLMTNEGC